MGPVRSAILGAVLCGLCLTAQAARAQPQAQVAPGQFQPIAAAAQPTTTSVVAADYRIGPLDRLSITVFRVQDLSLDRVQVDASGQIVMPLIGQVQAGGRTTTEVAADIARRLGERYLRDPQVSVTVQEAVSQKVTVEGAVMQPGVYDLRGHTSLQEAIAMAHGPNRTANIRHVAILRTVNGVRSAAVFDLRDIRAGRASDPEIIAADTVVIEDSQSRVLWRSIVEALPLLAIFAGF